MAKHGGIRANSGRKSKAEEMGLVVLLDECWSIDDRKAVIRSLHKQAVDGSEKAAALLLSYAFGRPAEKHEHGGTDGQDAIKVIVEYVGMQG